MAMKQKAEKARLAAESKARRAAAKVRIPSLNSDLFKLIYS